MFKKVFITLSLVLVMVCVAGCGKTINNYVQENMSEITKDYFFGENDDFYATLSVGEREEDYLYNGTSTDKVDFALLTLTFKNNINERVIWVQVASGENSVRVEAEYNDVSDTFMVDIIDAIAIGDSVFVNYNGSDVELEKISSNFTIKYDEALNIACENLQTELEALKSYTHFNGECYLRVLNQKENNFDDFYWCFTCLGQDGNNFSIIISTSDGSILAKS